MNTQHLLENFSAAAEAPGGVVHLRELILRLTIRGRLVAGDVEAEHAAVLLRELAASGALSTSEATQPVEVDDEPWGLPDSWCWARLKQVCDFKAGRTPPTKDARYWAEAGAGYNWVSIGDMPDGGEVLTTARAVSKLARDEIFRGEPDPPGTLLMSFKLTIGKVARLTAPAFHNEAIVSIASPHDVMQEYLFRTLPVLTRSGKSKAAIMGNTLNKASLTNLLVPVPPLLVAERIVAKVDHLMGLCDTLQEALSDRDRCQAALSAALTAMA